MGRFEDSAVNIGRYNNQSMYPEDVAVQQASLFASPLHNTVANRADQAQQNYGSQSQLDRITGNPNSTMFSLFNDAMQAMPQSNISQENLMNLMNSNNPTWTPVSQNQDMNIPRRQGEGLVGNAMKNMAFSNLQNDRSLFDGFSSDSIMNKVTDSDSIKLLQNLFSLFGG